MFLTPGTSFYLVRNFVATTHSKPFTLSARKDIRKFISEFPTVKRGARYNLNSATHI